MKTHILPPSSATYISFKWCWSANKQFQSILSTIQSILNVGEQEREEGDEEEAEAEVQVGGIHSGRVTSGEDEYMQ